MVSPDTSTKFDAIEVIPPATDKPIPIPNPRGLAAATPAITAPIIEVPLPTVEVTN